MNVPPSEEMLLIFYLRTARRKARDVAVAEALCLLQELDALAPRGGPLSEQGGLFWIGSPTAQLELAIARLPRLGYSVAVDLLEPASHRPDASAVSDEPSCSDRTVHWRRRPYRLVRVYEEDAAAFRESAPDQRVFLFESGDGEVRAIQGYRGDGGPLSRRGLPVCDARMLVNLTFKGAGATLLDPFAGIGGIVREAIDGGRRVFSTDIDPALRHGLAHLGARHCVADAARLPYPEATFDAVATEPPYHREAEQAVLEALSEMARVVREKGRIAVLCAAWQAEGLRARAALAGLNAYVDAPIDRKGLDVVALAWQKPTAPAL